MSTGQQGSAQSSSTNSASASQLISTLVPVLVYATIYFVVFLVLRKKFPRQYSPRSFLGSLRPHERSPTLPTGLTNWLGAFWQIPDTYVLNHHSLDAYLLLRLLKQAFVACLVGMAITWPILIPVNATADAGNTQFDRINMSNIKNTQWRYFAHTACAYLFFGYILFMITRESIFYINLRQAYLLSPLYASRLSSRTVLFTSVPDDYADEAVLRRTLGEGVRRVWIATDTKELDDLVKDREKMALKLEAAETKLIRNANGARIKAEGKGSGKKSANTTATTPDLENGHGNAQQWLDPKKRPTHRLKPLIGKKVDTIDWCRAELTKIQPKIEAEQTKHKAVNVKKVNSVFVEFATLALAQDAYQSLTHHQILHMAPRFTGMSPGEIIWKNLRIKWWERIIRLLVTTAIVTALIIFWTIPVAFVGAISNVQKLAQTPGLSWLSFISKAPPTIVGLINGLLPSILLAVLMAVLPIFLRLMAKMSGDPTLSAVELSTQNYYFGFQVIQAFLVITLGSAASAVVSDAVKNPGSIVNTLATQLPLASNFFLSYFVLQGLAVVSSKLLHIAGVVIFILLSKILDSTPRKMYKRWVNLSSLGWGTVFPIYTNLFVIAICYAIIAPFVLLFAVIGLYFFYIAYRYNLLFVNNCKIDTHGRVYAQALQHLFVGLYVAEACLIGLFAIGTGSSVGAVGPLILMIMFLIFTVLYHMSLNAALKPLIDYLPKSLEAEERRLLNEDKENGINGDPKHEELGPAPHKKPNVLTKFLKPHIYNDYATMRRLVPREIEIRYEPHEEANAYYNPSINAEMPLLWIPHDNMGISVKEVRDTPKGIKITDDGATLDAKNKIQWDQEGGRPPIWEPEIYY